MQSRADSPVLDHPPAFGHHLPRSTHTRPRPRSRPLRRAFAAALLTLGRRTYAEGIDDGLTGALIREAQEQIRRRVTGSPVALEAGRDGLLMRLAEAALEDDAPLPGADAEYEAVRGLQRPLVGQGAALVASAG